MKLNGWQRIGVVTTAVWVLFILSACAYAYFTNTRITALVDLSATAFLDGQRPVLRLGNIFIGLVVPPILGWVLVYVIVGTYKWVKNGFRSHST